jgi:hypothetical protein
MIEVAVPASQSIRSPGAGPMSAALCTDVVQYGFQL